MIRDTIIILAGVTGMLVSQSSESGTSYLNIDYGMTLYEVDGPTDPIYAAGQVFREEDRSLVLTAGYAATRWFSAEFSYADHGRADGVFRANPDLQFVIPPYSYQTIEASDFSFRLLASTPSQQGFRVRGVAGYSRADIESGIARFPSSQTENGSIADFDPGRADGILYGLIFEYAPSNHLRLKLSWDAREYGDIRLQRTSLGLGLHY